MIKIVICDDNKEFLMQIEKKINELIVESEFSDYKYEYFVFNNSEEALKFCENCKVEIVFLDIDMPDVNGFDIADAIKRADKNTLIIFISNYDNYVYSSLIYRPFRYLRKSHLDTELPEALNSALKCFIDEGRFLELGRKNLYQKILLSNIIYIESNKNYCTIVSTDANRYDYRSTVSQLENKLKDSGFLRIHAAFLVNLKYIRKIYKNTVFMDDGRQINISRRFQEQTKAAFSQYLRK